MDTAPPPSIALIVPASNTVMELDFARPADPALDVTVWRIQLDSVTREAEERMLGEELTTRLEEIAPSRPDLVVFGCTSAGALGGLGHDAEIGKRIRDATGSDAVTVVGSMVEQLDALDPTQVVVFTPYSGGLTRAVASCVTEAGYHVAMAKGMGLVDNTEVGMVEPGEIAAFVRARMEGLNPDAVFLSCTNWRAVEAIEPLSEALGLPVLTSNQVTLDSVRNRLVAMTR